MTLLIKNGHVLDPATETDEEKDYKKREKIKM